MRIGGFQKISLIDYPRKISSVIFTCGCNFRCPYCHNPELVMSEIFPEPVNEKDIFSFLKEKKEKVDGVVITGGEPTIHPDLPRFMEKVKKMGYSIKLDTNGSNPEMLGRIIKYGLVDYIAMDIKAPLTKYSKITRTNVDIEKIARSIQLIFESGIEYEFRTTVVKELLSIEDILDIGSMIRGAKLYVLQRFIPSKTLKPDFLSKTTLSQEEFKNLKKMLEKLVDKCFVR
ncbi:MAG: anaerobic ribonucleoside-triphosphate reductase activating protein [Thermoplasmata archaeon]|nr:MAG: anaerobic ribonucleoside-triphosphate reductase activating protein [Thermoplasmata archaeon]